MVVIKLIRTWMTKKNKAIPLTLMNPTQRKKDCCTMQRVTTITPPIHQAPATMQRVTTIATITAAWPAIRTPHTIIQVAPTTPQATIAPPIHQAPATMKRATTITTITAA